MGETLFGGLFKFSPLDLKATARSRPLWRRGVKRDLNLSLAMLTVSLIFCLCCPVPFRAKSAVGAWVGLTFGHKNSCYLQENSKGRNTVVSLACSFSSIIRAKKKFP